MNRSTSRSSDRYFQSVSLRYLPVARDRDRDQYLNHRWRVTSPKPLVSHVANEPHVTERARKGKKAVR